jgi:1,4-alpha-glucan branching enzyme
VDLNWIICQCLCMNDALYQMMNWEAIEAIVYSEHDNPHEILGPHKTENGVIIQCFFPNASEVKVKTESTHSEQYEMEQMDEAGFFSVLLPQQEIPKYKLIATYLDGNTEEVTDPYSYPTMITKEDCENFRHGVHYKIYECLGAHVKTIRGVKGTLFAVWAPMAIRVSVVGDFNLWDGRKHPMRRLSNSGIYELFIPGVSHGELYKFEIKAKGGLTFLKSDPYAFYAEVRPNNASIVYERKKYPWEDKEWLAKRKKSKVKEEPMSIYEVHLGSFRKPTEENGSFYNYKELAPMLASYIKEMGYTHIEIMPIMEHPLDASWGYQVTGYYATTSRYGTPDDFKYFMNYMHQEGIGVILDWVPAHFPRDAYGLSNFDGTCLYEHKDPRKGSHPHWGTLIFNYGRPQVSNFLIANALFWLEEYHVDGIRMDAVASMLYLDYGKKDGEWVANEYGGHENLEAMEMLKHLNSIVKKRKDGTIIIAEESTAWPMVTGDLKEGGLGFDFKWNMGWMNDFTNYMKQDPLYRKGYHGALTFSMVYAYSENFILVLSHDEVVHGKGSMIQKMPGELCDKFANLRVAYGYMMTHPGKKLLFMGQEFGQFSEWNEEKSLDWDLLKLKENASLKEYVKHLHKLYLEHSSLYETDHLTEGFEWVSSMDADHSIISFVRTNKKQKEKLFVILNFTPVVYKDYYAAVPVMGKYKEILNSDDTSYGGKGFVNKRMKNAIAKEVDGKKQAIKITLPPLGMAVFRII